MKTIGIIGAMEEEIVALKEKLEIISVKNIVDVDFYMGKLCGKNVVLVRSGIGKVNAAVCTQVLSDMYGVDCVINTGVAGALAPGLSIGDIVISRDVAQHDFDAVAFGYEPGVIPRLSTSFFPADDELISCAQSACAEAAPGKTALVGRIASGDLFVSRREDRERIRGLFNAACAEMEGAAIGHACYLNKIPFVIIRSMSDSATESADNDFDAFVLEAAAQSAAIVLSMLKAM